MKWKIETWTVVLWLILFLSISFYISYLNHLFQNESNSFDLHKSTYSDLFFNGSFLSLLSLAISAIPFSILYQIIKKHRPTIFVFIIINALIFFFFASAVLITSNLPQNWQGSFYAAIILYSISLLVLMNIYYLTKLLLR